jgi:hypothetical protein
MKKFLTIPLALLILLSGMHFTVASHYCGGNLAATKLSFSGKQATCGMIMGHPSQNQTETRISRHCCDDKIAVYQVDNNYSPSAFHLKDITHILLHEFSFPEGFSFQSAVLALTPHTNTSPPDYCMANAVRIADICVFRI